MKGTVIPYGHGRARNSMREEEIAILVRDIIAQLNTRRNRGAWDRGVTAYAVNMLEGLDEGFELAPGTVEKILLDGSRDCHGNSRGGCNLI